METETSIANFTALPETRDGHDLKNNLEEQENKIDELMNQVQEQRVALKSVQSSVAELKQSKEDAMVVMTEGNANAKGANSVNADDLDEKLG